MQELAPLIGLVARVAIGAVFLIAGAQKLRDIREFAISLQSYGWLPGWTRNPLAVLLPLTELALGVVLVLGINTLVATLTALMMLLAYSAAFLFTFGLKLNADCGCLGIGRSSWTAPRLVGRNLSLSLLAIVAWTGSSLDLSGGTVSILVVVLITSLAAFVVSSLPESPSREEPAEDSASQQQRRRFLKLAVGTVTGVAAAAVFGLSKRTPAAEAACFSCGSCGTDYIFMYCTGPCCAVYLVKKFRHCQTYCLTCSESSQIFCQIPNCC